jgi:two-component system chemotaxis sensor kinase CheA
MNTPDIDPIFIVDIFRGEAEENLRTMEEAFVALEAAPDDLETLKAIFRAAHTLKGNAAGLGYKSLARFAHTVEDALRRLVQDALSGVDELRPEDIELLGALALEATGASPAEAVPESVAQVPDDRRGAGRRATDEAPAGERRSVRVSVEKLERLMTLMGEIAVSRGRLGEALGKASRSARLEDVSEAHRSTDRLLLDLQEEVMRARMLTWTWT